MKSQLQRFELEPFVACDDDLAVEHASLGQLRLDRIDQLGEISIERLLIAALNENFIAITKDERPESIPLWLEDPSLAWWKLADSFREHRKNRRVYGELHYGFRP